MARILVCGGRGFANIDLMAEILHRECAQGDIIIHGNAPGADRMSEQAAPEYVSIERYPAEWHKYGRAAGPIRNQQMLTEGLPDKVIAFPGGSGTADMVRRAKKAGIEVIEVT